MVNIQTGQSVLSSEDQLSLYVTSSTVSTMFDLYCSGLKTFVRCGSINQYDFALIAECWAAILNSELQQHLARKKMLGVVSI